MTYGSVPIMSAAPPMASATLPPGARASLPAGEVEGPRTYGSMPPMSAAPPYAAPTLAATMPPRATMPAGPAQQPGEFEEFDTGASELHRGSAPAAYSTMG